MTYEACVGAAGEIEMRGSTGLVVTRFLMAPPIVECMSTILVLAAWHFGTTAASAVMGRKECCCTREANCFDEGTLLGCSNNNPGTLTASTQVAMPSWFCTSRGN